MKRDSEQDIKIKIAVSLNKLAQLNIPTQEDSANDSLNKSYGKIALNADIRKPLFPIPLMESLRLTLPR